MGEGGEQGQSPRSPLTPCFAHAVPSAWNAIISTTTTTPPQALLILDQRPLLGPSPHTHIHVCPISVQIAPFTHNCLVTCALFPGDRERPFGRGWGGGASAWVTCLRVNTQLPGG